MRIGRSRLAELGRLRLGDGPIPTLDSLLALVGGRVPLLLEVKVDDDIWRWAPALRRALAGYAGPFGIMSFDARIPRLIKTNLPLVRRGLVVRDRLPALEAGARAVARRPAIPRRRGGGARQALGRTRAAAHAGL